MAAAPANSARNPSLPVAQASDKPMGDHMLKRPPTQSRKPNIRSGSMPNACTASALVESAAKCAPTWSSPTASAIHARAVRAFIMVSRVVKVLLATKQSVVLGSSPRVTNSKSWPSTLATKCTLGPEALARNASTAIRGPKSDPPIPMLMTSVNGTPLEL